MLVAQERIALYTESKHTMNLEEYAVTQDNETERKTRCKTCNLPSDVLEQVHAARAKEPKPISFPIISQWLKTNDIDITQATIRNHFVAGHHND